MLFNVTTPDLEVAEGFFIRKTYEMDEQSSSYFLLTAQA